MAETTFVFIFTLLFLQRFGTGSNTVMISSSNVTCIERERQSLLTFKRSITDDYSLLSTWTGVECCEWQGVECDIGNGGHVVKLDLRVHVPLNNTILYNDKVLQGKLSPSLQNLKHLRYLDLSMNSFTGVIPKFLGTFKHLEYLNLSGSGFDGIVPHHLGNLSKLQYLDLKNRFVLVNDYYGQVDRSPIRFSKVPIMDDFWWLSSLSSLQYLDLSGITIGNHIDWFHPLNMLPSLITLNLAYSDIDIASIKFVNFTSLNSLDLSINRINSTIPAWLSNITGLMHLDLHENKFHGQIPDFIGTLNALASIDLSSNSFDTFIPDRLSNLTSLVSLDLSNNMFSGPIPESFGLLSRLEMLDLNSNQLSGNIPMSLGQLTKLDTLVVSHNLLVGFLSEIHFLKLKNLTYLSLSSNALTVNFSSHWIPPFQLHKFEARSCNIGPHFPKWLQTQTNLRLLDLSNSSIRDTIPEWFENILSHIYRLDLSYNQIGGKVPRFHGYSSDQIGDPILRMNSNKFEGSLASFPSNVGLLDLSDNLLSGDVPQTDGTVNPRLNLVILSNNRFTGSVPVHLCKVLSIEVLNLSHNKFSGRLPRCLGNLNNLKVIDLSNNTITGVIPSSLGSLKKLLSLHLHNNRFEGDLPVSLQNLISLETLDLGKNFLTGNIPFWIGEKRPRLRFLNLQSNKFRGKIPLQLCQLNAQYINLAQNNITGTIPHCLGNLSGMITNQYSYLFTYAVYDENIMASIKGREFLITKFTIQFLTSLDLSSNNINGEIPDVLMNLAALKNLNLSRNLLKGQIPMRVGNLKEIESLDLSMNRLSGRIPQSLSSLTFLSHLNLSFNNLSGPIPTGNQLQILDNPSAIYEGNSGLCGVPVSRSCKLNDTTYNHVDVGAYESQDDTEGLWFLFGIGLGFAVGFIGILGSLHFIRSWRVAYYTILENVYGWLMLSLLWNLARIRRKLF